MPTHTVAQGDCMTSIAEDHGFFWKTLWDHPQNQGLKDKKRDPHALMPGDTVFIPDKREKTFDKPTGKRHVFKRKGVPAKLHVRILSGGEPRANEPFVLDVDGVKKTGRTDGDGVVDVAIPARAKAGTLVVGEGASAVTYQLALGHLDPVSEVSGVQARLANMGFPCETTGEMDDQTKNALRSFQGKKGLAVTGELDDPTKDALAGAHDRA
jgi:N-acetylmuramoyl-L-alanine amidase